MRDDAGSHRLADCMSMPDSIGFGVYVHWPYCARICPYCDFNVRKNREIDAARWLAALTRDLSYWAARSEGRRLSSLYFGGGTPSLAPVKITEGVIAACESIWGFREGAEVTLEVNPADADPARLASLRGAGINRLSLGVQSFDDKALKFLGRDHDGAAGRSSIDAAMRLFERVTADFIYALPNQTVDQWSEELKEALSTGLNHLSLYQLTVEPGTAFGRAVARGAWTPAGEERSADLFDATQEMTANVGLPAYEISNHAAPGEESQHNLLYWRQGDYVGVGPGAHGRITTAGRRRAIETERSPAHYLARVEKEGAGAITDAPLSDDEALTERLAMGLRTTEGAQISDAQWERIAARANVLSADGLLFRRGGQLVATPAGRRVLDAVLTDLL